MERVAETPGGNIRDGRRRKGERRRRLLLDATMRVIENGGVAAVSQRVVAQEAQVPPSTVTYYFPTIDELLVAALTACNDRYIVQLDRLADDDDSAVLDELARMIAESGTEGRAHVAAEYELFLLAARRADMRAEARRWHDALDRQMARFLEGPVERAGVTAAIDGLFLRYLGADTPPRVAEVRQILSRLVTCLRA